jgi:hypothetical protein
MICKLVTHGIYAAYKNWYFHQPTTPRLLLPHRLSACLPFHREEQVGLKSAELSNPMLWYQ